MGKLTLGSLFDGSGGFPLGGLIAGITPVWSSEIEPFPIRVATKRMPYVKHYGDVSEMDGGKIEPVDIITFGSPCQDMSVAGKRAGLDGSRSGLFYEAVRIIKEMRRATDGKYPGYAVWENVPGAFSSNGGEDFRAVLEALCSVKEENIHVPKPEKWTHAGEIMGDGFSIAWRVLDAEYWGVPQRRKRIFLVADFADGSAGKILFESEGVSGYSAEGFSSWQRAAGSVENGSGNPGVCLNDQGGERMDVTKEVAGTLRAEANHPPCVLSVENHPADGRITVSEDGRTQTLTSRMGTGGGNVPLVMEKPKTLKIRSGCEGGGKGALVQDDKSATLSCNNDQTVFVSRTYDTAVYSSNKTSFFTKAEEDMAGILTASDYKDPPVVAYGIGRDAFNQGKNAKYKPAIEEELQPTLTAKGPGAVKSGYAVRRLTPTECARLQGFPDWWCENLGTDNPDPSEIKFWEEVWETHRRLVSHNTKAKTEKQIRKWLKNPRSDAAEYKMWGNGVALPCVTFVLSGIVSSDDNSKE